MKDALIDRHGDDEQYIVMAQRKQDRKRVAVTKVMNQQQILAFQPNPVLRMFYRYFRVNLFKGE